MSLNRAAWLNEKGTELVIASAPYPSPSAGEIVVRTSAIAINPVDAGMQSSGILIADYPTIIGCDIAGIITSIGPGVTNFSEGDRVFGNAARIRTGKAEYGAFQEYVLMKLPVLSKIPQQISDEEAVVLPLGINTASACLFSKDTLGLALPPASHTQEQYLLVWGGSSSVGACTVQLATAAGYRVVTTASKRNFGLCGELGASSVFDHAQSSIVDDISSFLHKKNIVGAVDAIGLQSTSESLCAILSRIGKDKMIASVNPGAVRYSTHGIVIKTVFATTVAQNEIGPHIWGSFLYEALDTGAFKCKPDAEVVGNGLEAIQEALDTFKKGVSGKKLVVTLPQGE